MIGRTYKKPSFTNFFTEQKVVDWSFVGRIQAETNSKYEFDYQQNDKYKGTFRNFLPIMIILFLVRKLGSFNTKTCRQKVVH